MGLASPAHFGTYTALTRLLVKHGRRDLVVDAGLDEFLVDEGPTEGDASRAASLAADLEAMGPTYIKLGQLLSTRVDLLPTAYTRALTRLQDDVEPFDVADVERIVEEDLGVAIRHAYAEFDREPLAAASLGQVHRAVLRSGREVVVKVQRPGIRDRVRDDMAALTALAEVADQRTDVGRIYGLTQLLAQFRRSLAGELDYRREAANLELFRRLTAEYDRLQVAETVPELCSSRVITMDFVPGRKVTDIGPLGLLDVDARPIVDQLFAAYLRMILVEGVIHADPHPGNVLLTPSGQLGLLDLGMVATVSERVRGQIVKLLLALSDGDGETCAEILAGMGHPLREYDPAGFRDSVSHLVSRAVALGGDVQAGSVIVELSRLSGQCGLRPPAEMSMIGKALLNLDQITAHLDPTFAPAEAIRANVSDIMTSSLRTSIGGMVTAAIEAKEFSAALPRRANRILEAMAEGEFSIRVNAINEARVLGVVQQVSNRLTMGLVLAALTIGAALMMRVETSATLWGYPVIATVLFLLAAVAGLLLVASIALGERRARIGIRTSSPTSLGP